MAVGFRHFTAGESLISATDVRVKIQTLKDLLNQLVALNIGWSIYAEEYSDTSYTSSACIGSLYLRYKNSDHLVKFYISGSLSASGSTNTFTCQLMAKGLSKTVPLVNLQSLYLCNYSGSPYQVFLGLSVYFGGSDWSFLAFKNYTEYTIPSSITEYFSSRPVIMGSTLEKINDSNTVIESMHATAAASVYFYSLMGSGYLTNADSVTAISGTSDKISPNNPDFEVVRPLIVNLTNWKARRRKLFSNSYSMGEGTVFTISSEKWMLSSNQILQLSDT